ncbi:cupin domain-containing protein [Pseudomonas nitroreducens]|uniref:cupin domain-containing protein n=1 Tax=Pseudomonas nitroreducens TaxID=46680 RepID=UPI003CC811DA
MAESKGPFFNGAASAPHIRGARGYDDLVDWGVQSDALEGVSHSSGRLLFKGPNNSPETGLWVCTPGRWRLSIPRDELCHFVAGRATYRSDEGEVIEVEPDTLVLFPAGWTGECTVHTTLRNLYMLA